MPRKGKADQRTLSYWKAVMADFERSGLSGLAYCRTKRISYSAFASRRKKLSGGDRTGKKDVGRGSVERVEFAQVAIKPSIEQSAQAAPHAPLEIVFPAGVVLRVPDGYSTVSLAEIISVLEV